MSDWLARLPTSGGRHVYIHRKCESMLVPTRRMQSGGAEESGRRARYHGWGEGGGHDRERVRDDNSGAISVL